MLTETNSTTPIYEILENLEFEGEYYTYGYYTKEELDKYELAKKLKCDNKDELALGEGTSRKCNEHDIGFVYNKIDSVMMVKINDEFIEIKPNDWENVNSYKTELEEAGLTCEPIDEKSEYQHLDCKNSDGSIEVDIRKEGDVVAHDNGNYCLINGDSSSWCNTIVFN